MVGSIEQRLAAAYHEAGHAVIAHHLGVRFQVVDIADDAESLGCVVIDAALPTFDPLEMAYATPDTLPARLRRRVEGHIMVGWAGPHAEQKHCGRDAWRGSHHDRRGVQGMAALMTRSSDEREHFVAWLRARVETMMESEVTWAQITAVAEALLRRQSLTRREVAAAVSSGTDAWQQGRRRPAPAQGSATDPSAP